MDDQTTAALTKAVTDAARLTNNREVLDKWKALVDTISQQSDRNLITAVIYLVTQTGALALATAHQLDSEGHTKERDGFIEVYRQAVNLQFAQMEKKND